MKITNKKIAAPIILGVLYLTIVFSVDTIGLDKTLITVLSSIFSVVIAHYFWPSSVLIVGVSIFVVSVVFPLSVIYAIGNYGNISTSLSVILKAIQWHYIFAPVFFAIASSLFMHRITRRSKQIF